MKHLIYIVCLSIWVGLTACNQLPQSESKDLFNQVEALKLGRGSYVLGKILTPEQVKIARENPVEQPTPGLYKFQDGDLFVVAQKESDRVLILYEQYEPATKEKVQELVGTLFFDFGDPTILAHDKILYWVYDAKGIMTEDEYHRIKKEKEQENFKPLATLKLSSNQPLIGAKPKEEGKPMGMGAMGSSGPMSASKEIGVYYILSSQRLLDVVTSPN